MAKRKKGNAIHGWVNFYKPRDMTSTQAVGKIRWLFDAQKAGHAGTLDPMAEGVLPIALGEATKTVPYIQDGIKTYRFDLIWGEERDSGDIEGEIVKTSDHRPGEQAILDCLSEFTGEIQQIPPAFSAIKINGERAYDLARAGEKPEMKPRQVFIYEIRIIEHQNDKTTFDVTCGKGTYIRSLGRDIAERLGSCGYVDHLVRTRVGSAFLFENTIFLDKLEDLRHKDELNAALLSADFGLGDIPALKLTDREAAQVRQGQFLTLFSKADFQRIEDLDGKIVRAYQADKFIGFVRIEKAQVKPQKLLNT